MLRIADEDKDNNRQWEAEQLAREQRSRRYEKERDDRSTMKEEKEADKDEPAERFQYMVTTHAFDEEESPERNDAAEDAERELAYLDQQELLILYDQDQIAQVNAVSMTPTPQATAASWFASKPTDAGRPQTRSITQPRRSPRLDRTTGMKKVAFEVPLPAIKRPVA